ncbi:MAG TPA: formyltetrahydrofolate deformylase [Candidatus Binatia bacterium]|nr:formyltetrahydrofolate deformylase [Candidatus Binatia bacterium]
MAYSGNLAVLSVIGRDQKGVVARVSTYLAGLSINIEDIVQRVVEGLFVMTMKIDVSEMTSSLDELVLGLRKIGEEIGMETSIRLLSDRPRRRVAILVSKEPHCLEDLVRDRDSGLVPAEYVAVLSNHEVLAPVAERHGIPFRWHPSKDDKPGHFKFVLDALNALSPDLVVLARYMQVLPPEIVQRFANRIINIHPSLLPYHPGANAYRQAFEEGVRVSGCTAHFVTEQLDQGPVILQDVFHIRVGEDTLDQVKERGMALEGEVLSRAVQLFVTDQLVVKDKKVIFRPGMAPQS